MVRNKDASASKPRGASNAEQDSENNQRGGGGAPGLGKTATVEAMVAGAAAEAGGGGGGGGVADEGKRPLGARDPNRPYPNGSSSSSTTQQQPPPPLERREQHRGRSTSSNRSPGSSVSPERVGGGGGGYGMAGPKAGEVEERRRQRLNRDLEREEKAQGERRWPTVKGGGVLRGRGGKGVVGVDDAYLDFYAEAADRTGKTGQDRPK